MARFRGWRGEIFWRVTSSFHSQLETCFGGKGTTKNESVVLRLASRLPPLRLLSIDRAHSLDKEVRGAVVSRQCVSDDPKIEPRLRFPRLRDGACAPSVRGVQPNLLDNSDSV